MLRIFLGALLILATCPAVAQNWEQSARDDEMRHQQEQINRQQEEMRRNEQEMEYRRADDRSDTFAREHYR